MKLSASPSARSSTLAQRQMLALDHVFNGYPSLSRIRLVIERFARTNVPMVICGESGTGKRFLAQLIHQVSKRCRKRFVSRDACELRPRLCSDQRGIQRLGPPIEERETSHSECYARFNRILKHVDGGTLAIHEISELRRDIQGLLIPILDFHEQTAYHAQPCADIRIIALSSSGWSDVRDSRKLLPEFFFRFGVTVLNIPPLRRRRREIPYLAKTFVREFARQERKRVDEIDSDCMRLLTSYNWPGNVRELRSAIQRAVVFANSDRITIDGLPEELLVKLPSRQRYLQ
jgi:two-component system response regulator AtoC